MCSMDQSNLSANALSAHYLILLGMMSNMLYCKCVCVGSQTKAVTCGLSLSVDLHRKITRHC